MTHVNIAILGGTDLLNHTGDIILVFDETGEIF